MGKLWNAVKRAVSVALKSTTYVWERCHRTGNAVLRAVFAPTHILFGDDHTITNMPLQRDAEEPEAEMMESNSILGSRVRKLAAQILLDEIQQKDVDILPEKVVLWLGAMDSRQLARVMASTHKELESHLIGHKPGLPDVLAFDRRAIEQARAEYHERQKIEIAEQAKRAARMAESDRQMRELDDQRARSRHADEELEVEHGHPRLGYGI